MTVKEAIKEATAFADYQMKEDNIEIKLKVTHKTLYPNQKNVKFFDSESYGERKDLDDGELCKVDDMRAESNINFHDLSNNPFIHKLNNQFRNILEKVM